MAAPAAPPTPVRPPHPVPEPLQRHVDALSAGVKALLTQKGIPYWVMAQMAQSGYGRPCGSLGHSRPGLTTRWDLNFTANDHGWTNELRELISRRMYRCVRLAKETIGETSAGMARGPDQPALPWARPRALMRSATRSKSSWIGTALPHCQPTTPKVDLPGE